MITIETFNAFNSNGDNSINLGDDIESEHLDLLLDYCDYDGNG